MLVVGLVISPAVASAQSVGHDTAVPRTAWGAPDLNGTWDYRTLTRLERNDQVTDKAVLTAEEEVEYLRRVTELREQRQGQRPEFVPAEEWADPGTELSSGRPPCSSIRRMANFPP